MLLYRAINKVDEENINKGCGIKASTQGTKQTCLQSVSSHVANGSNPNRKDCWISTVKNFKICASEFSIPQMGGYNTAKQRKRIAVIERNKMINSNSNHGSNGNYTYISDGKSELDLSDITSWPNSTKLDHEKNMVIKYPNGKQVIVDKKLMDQHANYFINFFNGLNNIETFIFDMTLPSPNDRKYVKKSKYAPLNEFSFYDYYNYGIVPPCQGLPIVSGLLKNNKEVLIMNEIPSNSILKLLTFLEIDVLYALDDAVFMTVLNNIVSGNIEIKNQGQNIFVNRKPLSLSNDEQDLVCKIYSCNYSIIDLTYGRYNVQENTNGSSILDIYDNFKRLKRSIIEKVISEINQKSTGSIVEDGIFVAVQKGKKADTDTDTQPIKLCKYDLLLIEDQQENKVYKFSDSNYQEIWKNSVEESVFQIKDNSGCIVNCCFE
ncbi:hypothetical protein JOC37_002196 [Desulfohalotomaculum tongense]|uniref:hypothetical protein n=1 Tax=Desulforadius tongensis TaxID=1216062 RepID=UPI00195CF3DE|nr:hypothetical protein [Desulforadius tongensis]MBM7855781.1 hypothetical protein [Desulforadius tongensis]